MYMYYQALTLLIVTVACNVHNLCSNGLPRISSYSGETLHACCTKEKVPSVTISSCSGGLGRPPSLHGTGPWSFFPCDIIREPVYFFDFHQVISYALVIKPLLLKTDMENTPQNDRAFCLDALERVSRTFSLNIGVLRGDSHWGILLAYLLCRIADTIEDAPSVPASIKKQKLCEYASLFPPGDDINTRVSLFLEDVDFADDSDEGILLANTGRVFSEFASLPPPFIEKISPHVREMACGMADFQDRAANGGIAILRDRKELERYCYYVAGTVGLMLTDVFLLENPHVSEKAAKNLYDRSVAFGLGLQLTNIAKDFAFDKERGWCYVPLSFFREEGIDPATDTYTAHPEGFLRVHRRLITLAASYLDEALQYTLDIPRRSLRYRLFCLWPLFMALRSLTRISASPDLFRGKSIKISRNEVKRIIQATSLAAPFNGILRLLYARERNRLHKTW